MNYWILVIELLNLVIELLNFGYWIIELLKLYMYTLIVIGEGITPRLSSFYLYPIFGPRIDHAEIAIMWLMLHCRSTFFKQITITWIKLHGWLGGVMNNKCGLFWLHIDGFKSRWQKLLLRNSILFPMNFWCLKINSNNSAKSESFQQGIPVVVS